MIRTVSLTLLLGFSGLCFAIDDKQEPPLKYTLEIDEQDHELVLGKPVKIKGVNKNPTLVLRAASIRTFIYGDTEFQYPASFIWEAEIV